MDLSYSIIFLYVTSIILPNTFIKKCNAKIPEHRISISEEDWTIESEVPYPIEFPTLKEKRKPRSIDLTELEEEWMEEDMDEDDIPPDEDLHAEIERRNTEARQKMEDLLNSGDSHLINNDLVKVAKETEDGSGMPMVFVKFTSDFMVSKGGDPSHLSWDDLAKVCNEEYLPPLSYAVIEPNCYPIEPDGVMVSTKRPWEKHKVWDYFRIRDEIEDLTMDGRTVHPVLDGSKFVNYRDMTYDGE